MKERINFIKKLFTVLSVGILMSFTEPLGDFPETARVFFLNERAFWGNEVIVKINNKQLTLLPSNKYFYVDIEPNNISITIDRDSRRSEPFQANLALEPNQVYYLKIYREIDYFTNKLYLVRISEQTAKQAMKSMKLESSAPTFLKNE